MRLPRWLSAPENLPPQQQQNFLNVQMEAIGAGLHMTAIPFLSVFLTRLGATSLRVGLLTSIPALGSFLLTIPVGRFLQSRRNIRPWYGIPRLMVISSYALVGLLPFLVPQDALVSAVLWIRAAIILPQALFSVAFSVLMNAVSGPRGRYDLMSRRWSIGGLTTAVAAAIAGQVLDRIRFPLNYQIVFLALSTGGLICYYYSNRLQVPDMAPTPQPADLPWQERFTGYIKLVRSQRAFLSFASKRFVYIAGLGLAVPLFPLYYVRVVQASDAWIGAFNTAHMVTVLVGYALWTRLSRSRGPRFVLLSTTLALSFYPALVASTNRAVFVALYAGLAGIFAAGLNLVFFDELLKTVPAQYVPTFIALSQSLRHFSNMASPLLGTALADHIGLAGALVASAALRLVGFLLFVRREPSAETPSP